MDAHTTIARSSLLTVTLALCSGCSRPLVRSISCEQINSLRIGQTTNQVRSVLGEPALVSEMSAVPFFGREPELRGIAWFYSGSDSVFLPELIRDELHVSFYQDKLTWVSAYRKEPGGTVTAFFLVRDPRHPEQPEQRTQGEAFTDVFPCRNR